MTKTAKRDNEYLLGRLKESGRGDLIELINAGEMTVYKATTVAGLRKKRSAASRADQITYHFSRATLAEKRRFIVDNWSSVTRIVSDLVKLAGNNEKDQISSEEEQN